MAGAVAQAGLFTALLGLGLSLQQGTPPGFGFCSRRCCGGGRCCTGQWGRTGHRRGGLIRCRRSGWTGLYRLVGLGLGWLGRHSLSYYMLHQPVLIGLLALYGVVKG